MKRFVAALSVSLVLLAWSQPAVAASAPRVWVARFNGWSPLSNDEGDAVATSANGGRVFVAGYSQGTLAVVAYRAYAGTVVWRARYMPKGDGDVLTVEGLVASGDGRSVAALVTILNPSNRVRTTLVAFRATSGRPSWIWTLPLRGSSWPGGVTADGKRIYVAGNVGKGADWFVVAIRSSDGVQLWARRNGDPQGPSGAAGAVVAKGRLFVTGGAAGVNGGYMRTVAYDARSGSTQWIANYRGAGGGSLVAVTTDGSKLVVAGDEDAVGGRDWALVGYDASAGTRLWATTYDGPAGTDDFVSGLMIDPTGTSAFVTGGSDSLTLGGDYATARYDVATGARYWVSRYDNGDSDSPMGLALAATGKTVVVTGGTTVSSGTPDEHPAYGTVAYDSSAGTVQWSDVYDGARNRGSFPRAIVSGPSGARVYMTGYSGGTRSDDFVTIAYRAS